MCTMSWTFISTFIKTEQNMKSFLVKKVLCLLCLKVGFGDVKDRVIIQYVRKPFSSVAQIILIQAFLNFGMPYFAGNWCICQTCQ